jgi:DNA-binding transcriptional LysR family regulator
VHMFEKLPSGYCLTAAGEEVLEFADQMEVSSHLLETRVFGCDQSVRGLLRMTLAPTLTTHLLMPDFTDFARLYPDVEMEILSSGELANLTNREADVASRARGGAPITLVLRKQHGQERIKGQEPPPDWSDYAVVASTGNRCRLIDGAEHSASHPDGPVGPRALPLRTAVIARCGQFPSLGCPPSASCVSRTDAASPVSGAGATGTSLAADKLHGRD